MVIFDFIESFGVDLGTWVFLIIIAWYLFRGARAGKKAGSLLGRVVFYGVLILVSFGLAAALGYANLSVGSFLTDAMNGIGWVASNVGPFIRDLISGVI